MDENATLSEPLEDYLEVIARLVKEQGSARVRDIADTLDVHKSTVTAALHKLADKGLVMYSPYKRPVLTAEGRKTAGEISNRHRVLARFFSNVLLLSSEKAAETACRLEHAMDEDALKRLYRFQEFIENCPRGGANWIRGFQYYCEGDGTTDNCERCIALCLEEYQANKNNKTSTQHREEKSTVKSLKDVEPGSSAKIYRISNAVKVRRRLLDMGFVKGTRVDVLKVAPLGDPIEIKVKGYNLTLRKDEADAIEVEEM